MMIKIKMNIYQNLVKATPSWSLLGPSYRLAIKNYEAIAILFFIPTLLQILGGFYVGSILSINKNHPSIHFSRFSTHSEIGLLLLLLWLIISIINYPPAIYFRLQAVTSEKIPSIADCYRQGFKVFYKVLLSELAFLLIVTIGLVLLILPGVLLFRRYVLVPYYAAQNPSLSLPQIFKLSAEQSAPFMFYIYGTFLVILAVSLVAETAFGNFVIGSVITTLITYSVLFLPVMRYLEISKHFNKQSTVRAGSKKFEYH